MATASVPRPRASTGWRPTAATPGSAPATAWKSTPDTRIRVEIGSGYRLQPYVDDGVGETGPVARGRVEWQQRIGEFASLHQELRVETGRNDTFVRNALALEVVLQPNWTLRSRFELRHDSAAGGTATESAIQLRYSF